MQEVDVFDKEREERDNTAAMFLLAGRVDRCAKCLTVVRKVAYRIDKCLKWGD